VVVDVENDENWFWFLRHLRNVLHDADGSEDSDELVFLSDRQKGIIECVDRLFPHSPHVYCLRHLEDNMHKQFKHPDLKRLLWKAARATTEADFNQCLQDMRSINPASVDWLL